MRNFLIILGVVVGSVGIFLLYTVFFVEKPQELTVSDLGDNFVGKNIVVELERLRNLQIRKEIFKTPAYQALVDNSIEIKKEPVGRPNPFLPVGAGVETIIVNVPVGTSTDSVQGGGGSAGDSTVTPQPSTQTQPRTVPPSGSRR
jgi:hypothetical protein